MTITLKGIPPSLNKFAGRENSWEYRNAKQTWTEAVCWASKAYRPPKPYEHAFVTIIYFFPTRTRHDADNYCGTEYAAPPKRYVNPTTARYLRDRYLGGEVEDPPQLEFTTKYQRIIAEKFLLATYPPHGRLIDADVALRSEQPSNVTDDQWAETTLARCINNAPTIIEAEEGEE